MVLFSAWLINELTTTVTTTKRVPAGLGPHRAAGGLLLLLPPASGGEMEGRRRKTFRNKIESMVAGKMIEKNSTVIEKVPSYLVFKVALDARECWNQIFNNIHDNMLCYYIGKITSICWNDCIELNV